MYRVDVSGLAVQSVGYRYLKTYVLEDLSEYLEYQGYGVLCASDGLLLYSASKGQVVKISGQGAGKSIQAKFTSMKATAKYLLLQQEAGVVVYAMASMQAIDVMEGAVLGNLVVERNAAGFVDAATSRYYYYES